LEGALAANVKALAILRPLAESNPAVTAFQSDLARCYGKLSVIHFETGNLKEASESLRSAMAINQKLVDANPAVTEFQQELAKNYNNVATCQYSAGHPAEALESFQRCITLLQQLVHDNPAVTLFQSNLALIYSNIGLLHIQLGQFKEARESLQPALPILQKLVEANPTVVRFQMFLAVIHNNLGRALARQQQLPAAFAAFDAGLAIRKKLVEAEPKNPLFTTDLGYSYGWRGAARLQAGQPAEAAADLRRAVELWSGNPANDAFTRFELSRALALVAGLGGNAKSGVTAAEARAFADRAVAALADAIKVGWRPIGEGDPKGPDFDALRQREDFQKLLAELARKAPAGPTK
jgi:tetratricopeptide (TPR) repeat protein